METHEEERMKEPPSPPSFRMAPSRVAPSRKIPAPALRAFTGAAALAGLAVAAPPLSAEECGGTDLCPGAVIDAASLPATTAKTYGGHPIGDMLPERLAWQIRDHGLALTLGAIEPYPADPRHAAATEKYAGQARLGADKGLEGWIAGVPFPSVAPDDPDAAWKVVWNASRGKREGDSFHQDKFAYVLIDGHHGVERQQVWSYYQLNMKGRIGAGPHSIGASDIYRKSIIVALLPQDIKGVGTFTIRYNNGKLDDSWAYVRDLKRVRRLSGGAWMDPIGSTDELGDDFGIFGAYPTWYADYRLLGKATILTIAHSAPGPSWIEGDGKSPDQFPKHAFATAPYWNPVERWQPREVFILEGTPRPDHPYSRKVGYIDAETWDPVMGEAYDKKGDFWKFMQHGMMLRPDELDPNGRLLAPDWGTTVDFQRYHGTIFLSHASWRYGAPITEDDVSLAILEAQGR